MSRHLLTYCLAGLAWAAAVGPAEGQFVADKSDAPIGNSSFHSSAPQVTTGYVPMWTADGGSTHEFPDDTPGGTYTTNDFRLRTPADGNDYEFDGQLIVNNTNGRDGGLMYKGQSTTGVITINDLVLAGGHVAHQNGLGDLFQLAGHIAVAAPSTFDAKQGNIDILSTLSGNAGLTVAATDNNGDTTNRIVTLHGGGAYSGDIDVIGKLRLGSTSSLTFEIAGNGVNNSVAGSGWAEFNGTFNFDLSGASSILGDSWAIADVAAQSFGSSFAVAGFTEINNVWTSGMYRFEEATGLLSVSPPPGDVTGEGVVDFADYEIILAHMEQAVGSRAEGDLNGDGVVDLNDFAEWRLARAPQTPGNFVPEPAAAVQLLAGVALALAVARLRRPARFARRLVVLHARQSRHLALLRTVIGSSLAAATGVALLAVPASAQLANPIPTPIVKQGLRVELQDVVQFPNSVGSLGGKPDHGGTSDDARLNFFRESPDGRYFVNDLRGQLYTLDDNNQPQLYVDLDAANGDSGSIFPAMWFDGGLAAGFISYTFHPEFQSNGVFYTIHMESASLTSAVPDFQATDLGNPSQGVTYQTVITEWTAANPQASTWNEGTGSRREVLRVGTTASAYFHPYGDLQFNPTAKPGDADYGLLYVSGGDWGYINGAGAPQDPDTEGQPGQLQRLDNLPSSLLRIDPRSPSVTGGQAGLGDYTIPADNPFVDGDPNTLDEIYAFGFRNGHRMAWGPDGTLYVNSVGHANLEEVERVIPGGNYGWGFREGTFVNGNDLANGGNGDADDVFALTVSDAADVDFRGEEFLYPVAQYDHGEGNAIAGGFVYQGTMIPALYGKYVFGDIVNGRMFVADVAAMEAVDITEPGPTAPIEEIQLFRTDQFGNETNINLRGDILPGRVDLRLGIDSDGEIWVITKEDGYLRRLVGPGPTFSLYVDPATGQAVLKNTSDASFDLTGYSVTSSTGSLSSGAWIRLGDQGHGGWDEAPAAATALSETNPFSQFTLAAGEAVNLGDIFDAAAGSRDLKLKFLGANQQQFAIGAVIYQLAGDFDADDDVDAADLALWEMSFGADSKADADGNNATAGSDFLVWQRQFGDAPATPTQQAAPEPAAAALASVAAGCMIALRRRQA